MPETFEPENRATRRKRQREAARAARHARVAERRKANPAVKKFHP